MRATPSLLTLAARRANQTPYDKFIGLSRPAQEAIFNELCHPSILVMHNLDVWNDPERNEETAVTSHISLSISIRGVPTHSIVHDVVLSEEPDWIELLRNLKEGNSYDERIGDLGFRVEDGLVTIDLVEEDYYTASQIEVMLSMEDAITYVSAVLEGIEEIKAYYSK